MRMSYLPFLSPEVLPLRPYLPPPPRHQTNYSQQQSRPSASETSKHTRVSFVLLNDTWSQQGHSGAIYDYTLLILLSNQVRQQATLNKSCQPGDCRWPINLP